MVNIIRWERIDFLLSDNFPIIRFGIETLEININVSVFETKLLMSVFKRAGSQD